MKKIRIGLLVLCAVVMFFSIWYLSEKSNKKVDDNLDNGQTSNNVDVDDKQDEPDDNNDTKLPEPDDSEEIRDIIKFKNEYESLNSEGENGINVVIDEECKVEYKTTDSIIDIIQNQTGIVYFGFPTCPWCRNVVPILLEAAKENNMEVYYLNIELEFNNDDNYLQIKNLLEDYLRFNTEGEKILHVPDVYFIKNGTIVGNHLGSVDSQNNPYRPLTDLQREELKKIYVDYIKKIKEN